MQEQDEHDSDTDELLKRVGAELQTLGSDLDDYREGVRSHFNDLGKKLADFDFSLVQQGVELINASLLDPPRQALDAYLLLVRVIGDDLLVWADYTEPGWYEPDRDPGIPRLEDASLPAVQEPIEDPDDDEYPGFYDSRVLTESLMRRVQVCADHICDLELSFEQVWFEALGAIRAGESALLATELRRLGELAEELGDAFWLWHRELNRLYVEDSGALGFAGQMMDAALDALRSPRDDRNG